MLLNIAEANANWDKLLPAINKILEKNKSAPEAVRGNYAAHVDLALLYSYAYYAGVVNKFVKKLA